MVAPGLRMRAGLIKPDFLLSSGKFSDLICGEFEEGGRYFGHCFQFMHFDSAVSAVLLYISINDGKYFKSKRLELLLVRAFCDCNGSNGNRDISLHQKPRNMGNTCQLCSALKQFNEPD